AYPIGYFHIDIAQVSTEQGKLHLYVAIDRTSKFVFVQFHERATQRIAAAELAVEPSVPGRPHVLALLLVCVKSPFLRVMPWRPK
ncbi:hypothetical protein AB2C45_34190, partial [Pseudomonas aeruginosa]